MGPGVLENRSWDPREEARGPRVGAKVPGNSPGDPKTGTLVPENRTGIPGTSSAAPGSGPGFLGTGAEVPGTCPRVLGISPGDLGTCAEVPRTGRGILATRPVISGTGPEVPWTGPTPGTPGPVAGPRFRSWETNNSGTHPRDQLGASESATNPRSQLPVAGPQHLCTLLKRISSSPSYLLVLSSRLVALSSLPALFWLPWCSRFVLSLVVASRFCRTRDHFMVPKGYPWVATTGFPL